MLCERAPCVLWGRRTTRVTQTLPIKMTFRQIYDPLGTCKSYLQRDLAKHAGGVVCGHFRGCAASRRARFEGNALQVVRFHWRGLAKKAPNAACCGIFAKRSSAILGSLYVASHAWFGPRRPRQSSLAGKGQRSHQAGSRFESSSYQLSARATFRGFLQNPVLRFWGHFTSHVPRPLGRGGRAKVA